MRKAFDLKKGRYVLLKEEDISNAQNNSQNNNQTSSQNTNKDNSNNNANAQTNGKFMSAENDEVILGLKKKIEDSDKDYEIKTNQLKNALLAEKNKINQNIASDPNISSMKYDPSSVSGNILKIETEMQRIEKMHFDTTYDLKNQILQRKNQLSALKEAYTYKIPFKYIYESSLTKSKIYLDRNFIGLNLPIQNAHDFKRIFKNSNLIYGKDKGGYYICCLDQDDIDEAISLLEAAGYDKEELLEWIIPALCDRRQLL